MNSRKHLQKVSKSQCTIITISGGGRYRLRASGKTSGGATLRNGSSLGVSTTKKSMEKIAALAMSLAERSTTLKRALALCEPFFGVSTKKSMEKIAALAMSLAERRTSLKRALALCESFFGLRLHNTRMVDALHLGLDGKCTLAACSFSGSSMPAGNSDLAGTLQSNVGFEVLLCGF
jgi:hypothetical protein